MLLKVQNLHKLYKSGTHALKGVSFEVNEGEFLAVIGLSGSGKSTLLRCINRLTEPSSGTIEFLGIDVTKLKNNHLREVKKQIGMVFQQFNLIKRKSVISNVIMGRLGSLGSWNSIMGNFPESVYSDALRCLEIVGIEEKADVRADALSGGQQQRVAIARSLMQHPKLLLADEPVASLDPASANSIMQYFEKINKEFGTTIICNLHFLSLVKQYATRVIALKEGEIVFIGTPEDIDEAIYKNIYGDDASEVAL